MISYSDIWNSKKPIYEKIKESRDKGNRQTINLWSGKSWREFAYSMGWTNDITPKINENFDNRFIGKNATSGLNRYKKNSTKTYKKINNNISNKNNNDA